MENPGLPQSLWSALDGKLWHATSIRGFKGIAKDGAIKVLHHRYKCSFCKKLEGVSLFDFGPTTTDKFGHFGNARDWLGHAQKSRMAIWLEIDRQAVAQTLLGAADAHAAWHDKLGQLFAGFEACHRGETPFASIRGVLLIARDDYTVFQRVEVAQMCVSAVVAFKRKVPLPPENELVKALHAGRARAASGR